MTEFNSVPNEFIKSIESKCHNEQMFVCINYVQTTQGQITEQAVTKVLIIIKVVTPSRIIET